VWYDFYVNKRVLVVLALLLGLAPGVPVRAQAGCQYVLGFLALSQLIPQVMGPCVSNETPAPSGDSLQQTANGLAVYRAADNWTAFTDGFRTWINGPLGLQQRLNTERFPWEADSGAAGTTPAPGPSPAPPPPSGAFNPNAVTLRLDRVWTGLSGPLGLVNAGDGSGRLFVVEKRGTIRVIRNNQVVTNSFFLDIRDRVNASGSEQGLLGLAFHPRYRENGLVFAHYTNRSGDTEIVRFRSTPGSDTADVGSAQVILNIDQPAANHNGGHLLFGPDGFLYIGMGDGGGAGDQFNTAQTPGQLLGKMLRIDVDRTNGSTPYAIPAGNPFVGQPGWRPEIWAYGLRNPWRYQFDRATGDLYIADVGQNSYEEINFQPAGQGGQNYGWPRMEASHCFRPSTNCDRSGLTLSIGEYPRAGGCSVTGGFVYRGSQQPQLQGAYVFGDYCTGILWTLHRNAAGQWVQTQMADSNVQISSFGEDEAGEMFATGLGDGNIYRVVAVAR
jgi:glucose/arabinose dehydrogenase